MDQGVQGMTTEGLGSPFPFKFKNKYASDFI